MKTAGPCLLGMALWALPLQANAQTYCFTVTGSSNCSSGCTDGPVCSIGLSQCQVDRHDIMALCHCTLGGPPDGTYSECVPQGGPQGTGGSTSGTAPAQSSRVMGPAMGVPFFAPAPLMDGEGLRAATYQAWSAARSGGSASARGSARSDLRAIARDGYHSRRFSSIGIFGISRGAKLAFFSTLPTLTEAAPPSPFGDTWPPLQGPLPPIGVDDSKAQPIEGAGTGVHQGLPDLLPLPNPQPVNNPQECNKGWYYNPGARTCYFTQGSCQAAGTGGGACAVPHGDPTLDPTMQPSGHVQGPGNCPQGSYYNTCNRSCYWAPAVCQSQIPAQSGCSCMPR